MPKRNANTTELGTQLVALIDKVAPGSVSLSRTRLPLYDGKPGFEVTVDTRGGKSSWITDTLEESLQCAAEDVDSPAEDPMRAAWRNLTRMQREVVMQTLRAAAAKHMAEAAEANIAHSPEAHSAYALADAFHAAGEALDFYDIDEKEMLVKAEKLEPIAVATGRRKKPATSAPAP